jgi:cephalosporin hydroxylase
MASIEQQFHKQYYDSSVWMNTAWLGTQTLKCPFDLWIYQEIMHEIKPDVIIECGTYNGGSALYLASICDLMNKGKIITADIAASAHRPPHHRITYLQGSSTAPELVQTIQSLVGPAQVVMVLLDSDHTKAHVLNELRIYSGMVTSGSYLIVEDTNINGHPVAPTFGPGPLEAVQQFLTETDRFVVDRNREKFMITFNPGGYLRKL